MTTIVIVRAHCASNKEVVITLSEDRVLPGHMSPSRIPITETFLADGEEEEIHVFDDRVVTVVEVLK